MTSPRSGQGPLSRTMDLETEHTLKNHLAIILGFCELLLGETQSDDPRHGDLLEMQHAAKAALRVLDQDVDR